MNDIQDIIEAFADNEPVDPGQLKDALAAPEGRDYLIDLLVLRGFVRGDGGARPSLAVGHTIPSPSRTRWLSVAAAIAALSLAGGYYAGRQSGAVASVGESGAAMNVSAPEPTRVIRLEDSADWTERVAEN